MIKTCRPSVKLMMPEKRTAMSPQEVRPTRILIIENDQEDLVAIRQRLIEEELSFQSTCIATERCFREALRQPYDLILSEVSLPQLDGMQAIKILREYKLSIPIIFVSNSIGEENAVELLKQGAEDFILKTNLARLVPVIKRVLRDVELANELRLTESQKHQQEELLTAIVDHLPVGIWFVDQRERIQISNSADQQFWFGQKSPQEHQYVDFKIWRSEMFKEVMDNQWGVARAVREGIPVFNEMHEVLCFDKTKRTLLHSSIPVCNSQGQPIGAIGINEDLTEKLQLETALRRAAKMEAIGRLAGGIAHDLNNMLTVIQSATELLFMPRSADEDTADKLLQIQSAAERASSLTRQLLTFSKKQVIQTKTFDLNCLVTELLRMLRRIIGEDIEVVLDLAPSPPVIKGDPSMIEQVITNLVINSRDAMPRGGKIIITTATKHFGEKALRLQPMGRPGHFVCLSVFDTGVGMPAEVLEHLFEPFFTSKPSGKGTGLGLATAHGIVKQHDGWIEASSVLGKGSTFKIFIPAAQLATQTHAAELAIGNPEPLHGSETILLLEDEPAVREIAKTILKRAGYTVLDSGEPLEAMQLFEEHLQEIDLLLTDMILPSEMTGRDVADELRQKNPNLKVLFTSGYSPSRAGQISDPLDGLCFLPKPYYPATLLKAVRRSLDDT
jgi:two-component system, cell cycle sensor histidine kinase and response regulator CckA